MNITAIDFESYYDRQYSLRQMSIAEYVGDPRFHLHGLAVCWPDGSTAYFHDAAGGVTALTDRFGEGLAGTTVVCHHAAFDLYVLNNRFGIRPNHILDTMLMGLHLHGREAGEGASLKKLADYYGLPAKGDLDFMNGVRSPTVEQAADLADYACRDVEITSALVRKLAPRLTRCAVELPLMAHTIRMFTEADVGIDVEGIERIEKRIKQQLERLLKDAGTTLDELAGKAFNAALAERLGRTGRELPTKPGAKGPIPSTAKDDTAMQAMARDEDPQVRALVLARLTKTSADRSMGLLGRLRRIAAATGGRLPPYLRYYGAHTGRFAGGDLFNLQNLGKDEIGKAIRGLLIPRPGNRFILADLAQIEARVLAWLAGEHELLAGFAAGRDVYSEFASGVFATQVRSPTDADPPETRERLTALRNIGKAAVLGLGFGMGAVRFAETLKQNPTTAPLFERGELDLARCKQIVKTYRQQHPGVLKYGRHIEREMMGCVNGAPFPFGTCPIDHDGDTMRLALPSGRRLRYPNVRLDFSPQVIDTVDDLGCPTRFYKEGPSLIFGAGEGKKLYGGLLCENVVQATARDLLAEAILQLEANNLSVRFHVHDEVIVEVPETAAAEAATRVEQLMTTPPVWAEGLPVAAEVKVTDRYGK